MVSCPFVSMDYYKTWWIFVNHMGLNVTKDFETCWNATSWERILCIIWDLNLIFHVCQWPITKSHGFFYIIWNFMWLIWTLKLVILVLELGRNFMYSLGFDWVVHMEGNGLLWSPMDFFTSHVGLSVINMDFETCC